MNPVDVLSELRNKLLFHTELTREELSALTGLSGASITNYTRLLLDSGAIAKESFRVPGVKRPVERLRLLPGEERALAVSASPEQVETLLLGCDGSILERSVFNVGVPAQSALLRAIDDAVRAGAANRPVWAVSLCVDGMIAPEPGMIFRFEGIPDWEPCEVAGLLEAWHGIPVQRVFPRIMAATRGFASAAARPDRTGYLQYSGGRLRIGSFDRYRIRLGKCGTPGNAIHRSCGVASGPCFCGRGDCLAACLAAAGENISAITPAFSALFTEEGIRTVGIDWPEYGGRLALSLSAAGIDAHIATGTELITGRGLRELTAELIPISERITGK